VDAMLRKIVSKIFSVDLRGRLVLGFLVATCLTGLIATAIGIRMINRNMIDEVQRKVEQDINSAALIYGYSMERLETRLECLSHGFTFHRPRTSDREAVLEEFAGMLRGEHETWRLYAGLDMLTLVDAEGRVIYRALNPKASGDTLLWDPVVGQCISGKTPRSSTILMPVDMIIRENPGLSARLDIPIVKTPQSVEMMKTRLSEGMVQRAAWPLLDETGALIGVLAAGTLVNRNDSIVDTIRETVFHDEKYKGRDTGFATIFQQGIRVATNVKTATQERAVGTIVSKEVYERVILRGEKWIGRAFVVNDWYISAYAPLRDINGTVIGMLYTGILEAKYRDVMRLTVWTFLGVTIMGMIIAFGISYYLGHTIIKGIERLKEATESIASGDLNYQLPRDRFSEFDILDTAFNTMARSLKDRDERLQKAFAQITRTERLVALGQIAAGVAHEINNPLGGILLYSNLVFEELPEESAVQRDNMQKIIYQTNRCKQIVQNLLDFARAPSGEMLPLDINRVIRTALALVKDQSMFHRIEVVTRYADDLPFMRGDRSRLEQVFLNLFINAADAMERGGTLTISTELLIRRTDGMADVFFQTEKICLLGSTQTVKITVADTGKGIDRVFQAHIFEPFFTTKAPGQGTGLGLSIAYGIIQQHEGFMDVESEPGRGTSFIIFLPAGELVQERDAADGGNSA